jgi:ArsR family transcriptional regulator
MSRSKVKAMKKPGLELSDEALSLIASRFRLLGEPLRLKILNALRDRELSVTELVEATGAGQANVSKHLGLLLTGGLVARRKEGNLSYYYIADETIFHLCEIVCGSLGERLAAQRDAFGLALR